MIEPPFTSGQFFDVLSNAVAGALGGAVKWMATPLSSRDGLIAVAVGSICAIYLSPLGDAFLDPLVSRILSSEKQVARFGGFVIGIIGIGVVGFVMTLFKSWQDAKTGGQQ